MKRSLIVLAGVLSVVTAFSAVSLVGQIPADLKSDGYTHRVELDHGESYLIHHSEDVAIEIWVDIPEPVKEHVLLKQAGSEAEFPLPNKAAVRAQGKLIVSRVEKGVSVSKPIVRWRYVDTLFQSYSRNRQ